jgi:hypothetical protein
MAGILRPGADASSLDWSQVTIAETTRLRAELGARYFWTTANAYLTSLKGSLPRPAPAAPTATRVGPRELSRGPR